MTRGPLSGEESAKRGAQWRKMRLENRAQYLREVREAAEWAIAFLRYAEAAGAPIVFRKRDLIALRKR